MTQTKTIYNIKLIWNNLFDIRVTGFSSNWCSQTYEIVTVLFSELIKLIYYIKMLISGGIKIWKGIYLWWARKSRTDSCRLRPRLKLIAPPQGKLITLLNFRQSNYNMLNFTKIYMGQKNKTKSAIFIFLSKTKKQPFFLKSRDKSLELGIRF